MLGVLVNSISIILGALIGLIFKKYFSKEIQNTVLPGLALFIIMLGISEAIKAKNFIVIIVSLVLGGALGGILKLDKKFQNFGNKVQARILKNSPLKEDNKIFSKAFVTTSLIYCVGAMAILGSIESGLKGTHNILFTKALLDGTTAIFFTAVMGSGVIFSSISVFIYESIMVVFAKMLSPIITDAVLNELSALGGLLILGIGLNQLKTTDIPIGNLLPSLVILIILGAKFLT